MQSSSTDSPITGLAPADPQSGQATCTSPQSDSAKAAKVARRAPGPNGSAPGKTASAPAAPANETRPSRQTAFAKTAAPYALAFLVPFAVVLAAFAASGIYPFGDVSVMLYDMPLQYVDYFGWFSDVLRGDADLLYSNAAGLGGGMFSLFSYYLASPFNLLAAFWQPEDMPKFFSVLYLLKIPACALTCLTLLRGRFLAPAAANLRGARRAMVAAPWWQHGLLVALASTYALSGYVLGYASNIMWLDGVIMLPLAALGAYRLVQRRSCAGLFASCTAAVLFNWYTGYMVCLFSVLYFFCELARDGQLRGRRLATCVRFAATMLLAVGASLVVLLPTALSLLGGKGGGLVGLSSLVESLGLSHNPLAVPNLFCIGTLPGVNPHGNTPAIVISAFALVGLGVFFANGAVSKRAKLASGILFAVMASSLIFPVWTTVWSGFVVESSYTNRNGFAILLVLVLLAAEGMCRLGNLDRERRVRAIAWGGGAMTAVFAASIVATRVAKGTWLPSFKLAMLEIALLAGFTVLAAAIAHAGATAAETHGSDATDAVSRKASGGGEQSTAAQSVAKPAATAAQTDAQQDAAPRIADSKTPGANLASAAGPTASCRIASAVACAALAILLVGEQVYASYLQLAPCCYPVSGYANDVANMRAFYQQLPAQDAPSENGGVEFTRVANAAPYWGSTKAYGPDNMALLLAYSTFDHYSSTQESRIQELLAALGYTKYSPVGTYYRSQNIVADALLGVTHIVDDSAPAAATLAGTETLRGAYNLYRNDLALPLGWGTTGQTSVDWEQGQPFANQNALLKAAADNATDVFAAPSVSENDSDGACRTFTITPAIDGPVMLYAPTLCLLDLFYDNGIMCDVYVDGRFVQTVGRRGSFNEVTLGEGHAGQPMQVSIMPLGDDSFEIKHKDGTPADTQHDFWDVDASDLLQVVSVDVGSLSEQLSRIKAAGSFTLTAYENGHIAATFNAAQDETLVISQPYENGWSVTVNGQPAELNPTYEGLMGVQVPAGENTIELRYLTPGLVPGAIVSIASVTLFGVWRAAARKRSMGARQG